jgi:hypothetical protein
MLQRRNIVHALIGAVAFATSCTQPLDETSSVFYRWDGRRLFCAKDIDEQTGLPRADITAAMDYAQQQQQVLQLFAHVPGRTVSLSTLEFVFAAARDRNLPFLTYRDLLDDSNPRAGITFSFDDTAVAEWFSIKDMLNSYRVRASFFVTRYANFDPEQKQQLRELQQAGHTLEAHSATHQRSPLYVETYGLRAFLDEEVLPSLQLMRADGFDPQIYAYPFGARTTETDRAIMPYVKAIRSLSFTRGKPLVSDPCPF